MRLATVLFFLFNIIKVNAQSSGQVKDAEFIISKERSLSLPKVDRQYVPFTVKGKKFPKPDLVFGMDSISINLPKYMPTLKVEPTQIPSKNDPENSLAYLAYGNLRSILAGVSHQKQGIKWNYGTMINLESFGVGPIRQTKSAYLDNDIALSAGTGRANNTLMVGLNHKLESYYFYGMSDEAYYSENSLFVRDRVKLHSLSTSIDFMGITKNWEYQINMRAGNFSQGTDSGKWGIEKKIDVEGQLSHDIGDYEIGIEIFNGLHDFNGATRQQRSIFGLKPYFKTVFGGIDLDMGLKIISFKDTTQSTEVGASVTIGIPVGKLWKLQGGLDLNVEMADFQWHANKNPYLEDSLQLKSVTSHTPLWVQLTGIPIKGLTLDLGLKMTSVENPLYYIPSVSDSSRFMIISDSEGLNIFSFYGNFSYDVAQWISIFGNLKISQYDPGLEPKAWNFPISELSTGIFLSKKLFSTSVEFVFLGGRWTSDISRAVIPLGNIVDLSWRSDFRVGKKVDLFIVAQNLLNMNNPGYLAYPSRNIALKLGLTFNF